MTTSVCFGGESRASAQRYFRASLPAQALARLGWRTNVAELVLTPQTPMELMRDPRLRGGDPVHGHNGMLVDVKIFEPPPDIITLRLMDDFDLLEPDRPPNLEAMPESIRRARKAGQIVLVDLDDDVWNIPAWSPASWARNRWNPRFRCVQPEVLDANLAAADGMICSTPRIEAVAKEHVPELRTWVIRNGIDASLWPWPRKPLEHDPLRVGWMGSVSHHAPHLATMSEALVALAKHDAEFVFLGWTKGFSQEADDLLTSLPCKTSYRPWVDFGDLPQLMAEVDIGIIPRVDTPFNEGQSTTSGLEYACAGVPFIAFPSAEYLRAEELGIGRTAATLTEWYDALTLLLTDHAERDASRNRARRAAAAVHGPLAVGAAYANVFTELVEERGGTV